MINRSKKILLFPVETIVRELDFRLVLAMYSVRPDWQIIVGEHEVLLKLTLRLENAVGVFKNVTGGKVPWKYQRYKEQNIRVIHLDEEGAIYEEGPEHWKEELSKRLDVSELVSGEHLCAWGQFQADYYKSQSPACADNIVATGHPRFNLCSPRFKEVYQEEAEAFRKEHGKFILINTNLLSNNSSGPDINFKLNNVRPEETERRSYYIEQYCYENHRLTHFVEMVNHLSNSFPGHKIVFRPHPSEDIRLYQTLFKYIPRVIVTRHGSLNAWLHACQVLVHDGCTTAIEGHLSGTPVINYHPLQDDRYDIVLPNLVGSFCRTLDEVTAAIRNIDDGGAIPETSPENIRRLTELILNFDKSVDSFERIAAVISQCQDESPQTKVRGGLPVLLWHRLTDPIRSLARPYKALNRLLSGKDHGSQKFPPLDRSMVLKKLAVFEKITGKKAKITFHSSKFFSVTAP